jgi:hypothetical protein
MRSGTAVAAALLCGAMGCSAMRSAPQATPAAPTPLPEPAPVSVPTVPPGTPAPAGGAPLPTRPVKNPNTEAEKKAGKVVGPIVTFAGLARADGQLTQPFGKDPAGIPIYRNPVGSGFVIVVEAKPGVSNVEVGRSIFKYDPQDPTQRPDLEIEVNRPLGDGSEAVCDARPPKIGGIPAIDPPSFAEKNPKVSAALNDLSCRFETFIESNSSCTVAKAGEFSFVDPKESKVQFCMVVAHAWNFPDGDTLVSVRLRDVDGNPGPVTRFIVRRQPNPTPPPRAMPSPTPTAPRRRP